MNAWPALNSMLYDGWILRFANGYTKRANSVTPLYAGDQALSEKVVFCEKQYRRQKLRPIFRLPHFATVEALDSELACRGYKKIDPTSVQVRQLGDKAFFTSNGVEILTGSDGLVTWLGHFHTLNAGRPDSVTHEAILRRILGDVCAMVLKSGDRVVACGLGVRHGPYLGLFDIVTDEAERRKGYGRALTESLLAWGLQAGAMYAYLQVMLSNLPAQSLYRLLGFDELYCYWYRVAV